MKHTIVYADFNCPFCYALNEQLEAMDKAPQIEWRMVEHIPGLGVRHPTYEDQVVLAEEVLTVRNCVPGISISLPDKRLSSALATAVYASVQLASEEQSRALRGSVFRALWQEGLNINDPGVLKVLAGNDWQDEMGVELNERLVVAEWQRKWEEGPFDGRLPCMQRPDEHVLVGLAEFEDIVNFLQGEDVRVDVGSACELIPRQTILFIGQPLECWDYLSVLEQQYNIRTAADHADASAIASETLPDMALIEEGNADFSPKEVYEAIWKVPGGVGVPIVILGSEDGTGEQEAGQSASIAEYLPKDVTPDVFQKRISIHLAYARRINRLSQMASVDGLTELVNRREFNRVSVLEWRRGLRLKSPLTIMFIDIDHFKKFNDHYGHLNGDGCLRRVAWALSVMARRAGDLVARYGGEEFVAIFPGVGEEEAMEIAMSACDVVEKLGIAHEKSDTAPVVTVSVGVSSVAPTTDHSIEALISSADAALYEAKTSGRNCTRFKAYQDE